MVRTATTSHLDMRLLSETIEHGFPDTCQEMPDLIPVFFQLCDDLYTIDSVVMYKDRIVIPPLEVLAVLHRAHQGVTTLTACAASLQCFGQV